MPCPKPPRIGRTDVPGLAGPRRRRVREPARARCGLRDPFPIPGHPTRLEGREAVREYLAARWSGLSAIEVHAIYPEVYDTTDPNLFFVENEVEMTRPGAGRARIRTSVNVVRVRDGEVVLFRDYMDTARTRSLAKG
jgi:ketosteroid isomerase-like protein